MARVEHHEPHALPDAALHALGERTSEQPSPAAWEATGLHTVADALVARGIPFVFATGYDAMRIPQRFKAISRCQKPIDPLLIAQALSASLELVR